MTDDFSVAIPSHYQQEDIDLDALLPHVPRRTFHDERALQPGWTSDATGVITDYLRVTAAVLDQFPRLRVLSFAGTGVGDWVDVPYATRRGIAVCNVPDWGSQSIAEFTFGLLLAVARKIVPADRMARSPVWREEELRGLELRGMTMGLVGLGAIGQRVAELAEALGLRVLCTTRRPEAPRATTARVEFVPLDELLRRSNILSLHCALTDETRGLIGARELALLPPGAILLNTARGPIVDTDALVEALRSGRLWGAGLDVFDQEPLPQGHPLQQLDNVVLAPHIAGQTATARRRLYATSVSNIDAFAAGNPVNVVNPDVLKR